MVRIDGDYHPMNTKERAACGVLCVCMMVSVLSGVALIYLTVIIYIPAQKELASGFGESSVMCTTIEKRKIKVNFVIPRNFQSISYNKEVNLRGTSKRANGTPAPNGASLKAGAIVLISTSRSGPTDRIWC